MKRKARTGFSLALLLLVAAASFAAGALWDAWRPVRLATPVTLEIAPGTNSISIARQLEAVGVVRSPWPLLLWHELRTTHPPLRAGEYRFEGEVSVGDVYAKLVKGEIFYRTLLIPEGYNMFEVAAAVEQAGFAKAADFLAVARNPALVAAVAPKAQSLEGFLFPDTYRFARHATAQQIAQAMVARFQQVFKPLAGTANALDAVTLASLVEKETGKPSERPLVAGVFRNRLAKGMPLQCDPTVVYAALLAGAYRGTIYASDLKRASPYNTYVNKGLPPGPVANPGRASLEAAARPSPTDFLYFVADTEGGHVFSRTLAEHDHNVAGYRKKSHAKGHAG